MDVRSDLDFFSSSDRNSIEDVLKAIASTYALEEAWCVHDHDGYDVLVVIKFSNSSARYTEVKLALEDNFQGVLFSVISRGKFKEKYGCAIQEYEGVHEVASVRASCETQFDGMSGGDEHKLS